MTKICQICGKEFEEGRRKYCSEKCYLEANRRFVRKKCEKDYPKRKCMNCGAEFKPRMKDQIFCCYKCKWEMHVAEAAVRRKVKYVAKLFDFEIKNMEKIIKAKRMMFNDSNMMRCPCDADNPNRYCGSPLCVYDTATKGHCHCSLMWSKKPLLKPEDDAK